MAVYKRDMVDINLETGNIHRSFLKHSIGKADSAADHFGVRVFRNGEAVSLTGVSVQGYFRDPQGNNIAITSGNIVSDNEAEVVLPQACYNYEGQFCLAIKLIGGGVTGTVRIVDGMVDNTNTGGAVAPTETVPTYQEVLAVYGDMQETLEEYDGVVAEQNDHIAGAIGAIKSYEHAETASTSLFESGTINAQTGENGTSTKRIRTKAVLNKNVKGVTLATGYSALIYAWNGSTYIGNWNGSSFIKSTTGNVWFTGTFHFIDINPNYSYKLAVKRNDEANISVSEAINVSLLCFTDESLTVEFAPADAKATGDMMNDMRVSFNAAMTGESFPYALNTTWEQGGVNESGEYSSWARIRTDYIELVGLGQITITPGTGYAASVGVYDASKNVTRFTLWSTQNAVVMLTETEKYIRICYRKDPEANLSPSAGESCTATAVYKLAIDVYGNSGAIKGMDSVAITDLIWELGGVTSGTNYNTDTRIRTKFYDVSQYGRLTANVQTGYKYVINVYDRSRNYLFMLPSGGFVTGQNIIEADENIGFIKVMLATENGDTLSDTSISAYFSLDADWKATGEIKNIANNETNLFDGITWVRGVLDNDGAYVSGTSRAVTDDYIDVTGCRSIHFHTLIPTVWYTAFFFGEHGVISKTGTLVGDTEIVVPSNAIKLKAFISNNPDAYLDDATIGNVLKLYKGTAYDQSNNGNILAEDYFCSTCVNKKEIPNLASGTTVLAFGDSITAEQTSAGWVYHFTAMTGCTVVNKAVGGSTFGHTETDSGHWISTQIANTGDSTWADADLVIVAAGTNDYGHNEPLDGIKQYVQAAITAIRAKSNAPIVFITPIRRGLSVYGEAMQKLPMISGIISNVALANQCNVICGFDIPVPTYNINGLIEDMTRDGLHPIETGANAYARFVIGCLI